MSDEHDSLSPDLRALVDAARPMPRVRTGARDAVRGRLAQSLGVPLEPPRSAASATRDVASMVTRRGLSTLLTFALGAMSGAAAYHALVVRRAPPAVVVRAASVPPQPVAPVQPVVEPVAPREEPPTEAPTPPVVAAPTVAPDAGHAHGAERDHDGDSLSRERTGLEIARTALTRGQSGAALDALERHARTFPHGRLAPERESLWVQALVSAGRYDAAREHAARFRRAFPGSMFQGVVDAALRAIPAS